MITIARFARSALLVGGACVLLLTTGCAGGGTPRGNDNGGSPTVVNGSGDYKDRDGKTVTFDESGAGIVRIVSVDRSALATTGEVTYMLENISGKSIEELTYQVQFFLPAAKGSGQNGSISLGYESEVTLPKPLSLYANDPIQPVTVKCDMWAGGPMLGTKIYVDLELPRQTVGRGASEDDPGTMFINGLLECVAMDGLFDSPARLELTLANRSSQNIGGLLIKAVFLGLDTKTIIGETDWEPLDAVAPNGTVSKSFDVSKAARTGRTVWIKMKQGDLF